MAANLIFFARLTLYGFDPNGEVSSYIIVHHYKGNYYNPSCQLVVRMDAPLSLIERSFSSTLKYKIRLAKCTKFKKKRIFRCSVADGPSSLPEVFLVKMARYTKGEAYDPESDCVGSSAWRGYCDASSSWLSSIVLPIRVCRLGARYL